MVEQNQKTKEQRKPVKESGNQRIAEVVGSNDQADVEKGVGRRWGGDGVVPVVVAITGTSEIGGLIGGSPSQEGGGPGFTTLEDMAN